VPSKSALAVKIFGRDLDVLEKKAVEIKNVLEKTPGFTELTVVRELGQPSLLIEADRAKKRSLRHQRRRRGRSR
jgi:heavy metal efflux system protein